MGVAVTTEAGEPRTRHRGRGHLPALDGVRGIAVLGVMANHLITGNFGHVSFPVLFFTQVCLAGVDLFFVLSGFLISGILLDSVEDGGYFRKFYARRALRIFPLYYGVLLLVAVLTRPLEMHWNGTLPSFLLYVQNLRVLPSIWQLPPQRYVNLTHLWSLAVEEQFYLVWPLVLWLVRGSRRVVAVCCLGIVLSAAVRWQMALAHVDERVVYTSTLGRMDQLLVGALLVLLLRSAAGPVWRRWAGVAFCVGFPAEFVLELLSFHGKFGSLTIALATLHNLQVGLLWGALIAWSLEPGSVADRVCRWRPLRFFGKYSYGLYVLHAIALPAFNQGLRWMRAHGVGRLQARAATGVLEFAVALLAAYCSFHLYEKQFLRLKRYFDYAG